MKAIFLFMLLLGSALFSGCAEEVPESENEVTEVKGAFTLNGQNFDIVQAYARNDGDGEFMLVFLTDGFVPELDGTEEFNGDGAGSMVLVYPFSASTTEIAAGSYTFTSTFAATTFSEARVGVSCGEPGDCNEIYYTEEDFPQTLEIAKKGAIYTITFSFNLLAENRVTGAYSGDIIYY